MLFIDITGVIKSDLIMKKLETEDMFNKDPVTLETLLQLIEREEYQLAPVKFRISRFLRVLITKTNKARALLIKHHINVSEVDKVEKAVPNCVTTNMGMKLLQIAKKMDQAGEEPSSEHPEILQFLDEYGHRANEELDVGLPRWEEEPGYVVSLIRSYIDDKTYREGIKKFNRDMEEAEQAIDNITAKLIERGARGDARKVGKWLRVVGVKDATSRFEDGQMVKINGETGSVEILDV